MNAASVTVTAELRARALEIAAHSGCDYRTALRALIEGVHTIRRVVLRDRIARALDEIERRPAAAARHLEIVR